jgi:predicted Zn-dependent protease
MRRAFGWPVFLCFVTAAFGAPCENVGELLKHDHMNLGVRFDSRDPDLVQAFKRALNFWSKILDMEWHEDSNGTCAIDLMDGVPAGTAQMLLHDKAVGLGIRSSGIVAIDTRYQLAASEWYAIAAHELGHLFGLQHNSNPKSVMYYIHLRGDQALDPTDIAALSARHRMRISLY